MDIDHPDHHRTPREQRDRDPFGDDPPASGFGWTLIAAAVGTLAACAAFVYFNWPAK